jgi:hypothetical protein
MTVTLPDNLQGMATDTALTNDTRIEILQNHTAPKSQDLGTKRIKHSTCHFLHSASSGIEKRDFSTACDSPA